MESKGEVKEDAKEEAKEEEQSSAPVLLSLRHMAELLEGLTHLSLSKAQRLAALSEVRPCCRHSTKVFYYRRTPLFLILDRGLENRWATCTAPRAWWTVTPPTR